MAESRPSSRSIELDVEVEGGRVLHVYDTGANDERLTVIWHHGTPNIGSPPRPLFAASDRLGIRWIGYDRPGYGGSTRRPGRDVVSAAGDVARIADALAIERFAVLGHSGGGPHALACAALMPDRVTAAAIASSLAPYGVDGLDWFAGMAPSAEAALRAALWGRAAKEEYEASAPEGDPGFVDADWTALRAEWSWFGPIVEAGLANGNGGLVDDDLAYIAPWGFDPAGVRARTLVLHGDADRAVPAAHGRWLADHVTGAELWLRPGDGHISVLSAAPAALEWLGAD